MKYNITNRFSALFLIAFAVLTFSSVSQAQILSRGDLFGPGAPPPLAGVEIGIGQHSEMGTLDCNCGSQFTGGSGKGFLAQLFFELPLDYEWAIGIKGGIDFKNFSATIPYGELVVIPIPNTANEDTTVPMSDNRVANIKTTYLDFAPYLQYQFFRMGPFVQAGLDVGFLMSKSFSQTRELPEGSSAFIRGQTDNNLTFTNGTLSQDIGISTTASSLRLGLLLSAGYNIQISERSIFSPLITYDFPLNAAGSTGGSDWKIGSLYASALIKFQLN